MNIRNAILAAADHIERNPEQYRFPSNTKPMCNTPGCLMGWIGFYLEIPERFSCPSQVGETCGFTYIDIGDFAQSLDWYNNNPLSYQKDAAMAGRILRLFADAKFPAAGEARSIAPPNWQAMAAQQSVPESAVDEMVRVHG